MTPQERCKVEEARVVYLDKLYQLDGRGKMDHPLRGRYTGLAEKYGALGI